MPCEEGSAAVTDYFVYSVVLVYILITDNIEHYLDLGDH